MSRTLRPPRARAKARAAATVVLPVPPLPVTTCSRTPSQSVSRALITARLSPLRHFLPPATCHTGTVSHYPGHWREVIPVVAALVVIIVILVILGLIAAGRTIRVVQQYE